MAITRWEPFKELARMQDEFNRLFDERLLRRPGVGEELGGGFSPAVDVFEDNESLQLTVELPGVEPKDVEVKIEAGTLMLKGERKLEKEEKKDHYTRMERSYGMFTRTFSLPSGIDVDKVRADFKHGLLKIHLPKKEEVRPKAIKVKVE